MKGLQQVVSSANLHEISGIVKQASQFKHIDSVFLQPIILHETRKHLDYLLLEKTSYEERMKVIDEISEMSRNVNVRVDGLDSIKPANDEKHEKKTVDYSKSFCCRYAWNGILSLTKEGDFLYFCCYMQQKTRKELLTKYIIPNEVALDELYNSKGFWQFRKDMLEKKLIHHCVDCPFGETSHNFLQDNTININERFYI